MIHALLASLPLIVPTAAPGLATAPAPQDHDPRRRITPVVEVVQESRPAVVFIQCRVPGMQRRDFWGRIRRMPDQTSSGSGVVIYEDGYIVTNNHVIAGAQSITVSFDQADDSTLYEAVVISAVEKEDLALLKIVDDGPFPIVPLGDSDPILGETVVAIGNPYGQTHTVSTGIISGLHRNIQASGLEFTNLIQTDASINPGNSGGPLLNINGELIGINTAVNTQAENIGFAIPVARVRQVLNEGLLSLNQARSWLGIQLDLASFEIRDVTPGGPAALAGLRTGDRLTAIDGKPLRNEEDYRLARLAIRPNDPVHFQLRRGRAQDEAKLVAWNRLDGYLYERLGLTVSPVRFGTSQERYLQVASVQPGGPADELGLSAQDVIGAVRPAGTRGKKLRNTEDLVHVIHRLEPGTKMAFEVWRDDDGDRLFFEHDENYSELYRGELSLR